MSDERRELLAEVAQRTLEDLAFLFSTPEEPGDAFGDPSQAVVAIAFSGPVQGRLVLALPRATLPELAANMLGIDEADGAEPWQQQDALRELLNIICGNLMPKIAGPSAVTDLAAPELIDPGTLEAADAAYRAGLVLDTGRAQLLFFEDDATGERA